ncbi:hypothetical protein GM415_04200 [Pseudodesulfovibrio cashew]|uniref:Uncharacterized protein n=1 Tax=Pseudodesulfovibrio cashew TaxID=2678688 RepID=A0A6I6JFR2_9BACT|nr:hypothetical protein [Pseudodesulfovibrio cashew]QGY39353.1 hypothetical protein GM415_04200 [Pseudodesulfovibrio cashew]
MIILLPLYVADSPFWEGENGQSLLRDALLRIREEGSGLRYVAASDSPVLLDMAGECGWENVRAAGPDTDCLRVVPGMEASLKAVRDMALPDEPVLVGNFRNPFLDAAMIRQAAELYAAHPGFGLLSVRAPSDHPCQFNQYLRFEGAGLLVLRDEAAPGLSLSCPWEWEWFEEVAGQTDYAFDEMTFGLKPVEGESLFLKKQDALHARCVVDEGKGGFANPVAPLREGGIVRADAIDGSRCRISFAIGAKNDLLLQVIPFSPETVHWESASEVTSRWPHPVQEVPFPDDCAGMLFFLFSVVEDGGYDMVSAFVPPGAPWAVKIGGANGRVSLDTGKVIHGRQAFPRIYAPDETLCVLPGVPGQAYDLAILERGYPLELGRRSFIIEEGLDFIAYEILRRQDA